MNNYRIIDEINEQSAQNIAFLLANYTEDDFIYAKDKAREITDRVFGKKIYIRGLIEIGNICKNNCYYCGIRAENGCVKRYRLSEAEILASCIDGYKKGFRTFVLQGGEDIFFSDAVLIPLIKKIKENCPDCAVTLSLGEREKESYKSLFDAGADRYLLRQEAADSLLYGKLHPDNMSYERRMECLKNLKEIGYQTGCGMMIGAPFCTEKELSRDIVFIRDFKPQMVGIGPFIPAKNTPFENEKTGSIRLTLFVLSLIRIMSPFALIPATTALQTLSPDGRISAIEHGANVIMPNLSPKKAKDNYILYNNKEKAYFDTADELFAIKEQLLKGGYEIAVSRGDYNEKQI